MKTARRPDELEQIRNRILDAAVEIIINQGFDALTMRKLASRIGMTAPNIYNYFANKDELYITIVIMGFERLRESLEQAYCQSDDPVVRARCMMDSYMKFGRENSAYYEIMFIRTTPKYRDYIGTPYEKLSEIEYRISMEIARLAMNALSDLVGGDNALTQETVLKNMVRVWSTLHGMISLFNSDMIEYVVPSAEKVYSQVIDDLVKLLADAR
ncbi:MAG TPA: TetR/AcrR family transcriptional regulator [Deltaproteobacteria bacterium]|nr:TetR/AcrR family transcriptional regulator [Deltaproteobacteria bacterium]